MKLCHSLFLKPQVVFKTMMMLPVLFLLTACASKPLNPWTTESPPPHGNWPPDEMPKVYRGPYEYAHPDRDEDFWPQNLPN